MKKLLTLFFVFFASMLIGVFEVKAYGVEIVDDSSTNVGNNLSLALDSSGNPHISYSDTDNTYVKYAYYNGTSWSSGIVEDIYTTSTSIDLTSGGLPRIAYFDMNNGYLRYADCTNDCAGGEGQWSKTTVDNNAGSWSGGYVSMKVDTSNYAHISYYAGNVSDLRYATNISGSWVSVAADTTNLTGAYTSIALDGSNNPRISYTSLSTGDLRYAYCSSLCTSAEGNWTKETVDSTTNTALTSLDLNNSDVPWISYYDETNSALKYAYRLGANNWIPQTIETAIAPADLGSYSSLKIGTDNVPCISYHETDFTLKFTCYRDSSWEINIVPDTSGSFSSLGLDSNNEARIAIYNNDTDDLRYAFASQPNSAYLIMNHGASATTSLDVTTEISADNSQEEMKVSEDPTFSGVSWENYAISKNLTLSSGEGVKTVYIKFRDYLFEESSNYSDSIIYDVTAPTTTASPSGGTYTSGQTVTLAATDATSGVLATYYTIDGSTPNIFSSVYSGSIAISATTTLKFFSRDNAGNSESVKTETYIISDPVPPTPDADTNFVNKIYLQSSYLNKNLISDRNLVTFNFVKLPNHPTKYYVKVKKVSEVPPLFIDKRKTLGYYTKVTTNLYKYKKKIKVKVYFKYKSKILKKRKLKEKNLYLVKYDSVTKKWETQIAKLSKANNYLKLVVTRFNKKETFFAIVSK